MSVTVAFAQSSPANPLVDMHRQVAQAEQRCERQVRIVSELVPGTSARDFAEHVLRVMEQTLSISRAHQSLIQQLETEQP